MMEDEDSDNALPPLYGNPKHFGQDSLFLDWILKKSTSSLMGDTQFQLFSLPALLYEMAQKAPLGKGGDRNRVPSLMVAEAQLTRDTFMYATDTCELHGEGQPGRYYCCTATVLGWSYILFSLLSPLYSLPLLENSHRPQGYSDPQHRRKVKSGFSFSDFRNSNPPAAPISHSAPSTSSSVLATSGEGSQARGGKPGGSGIKEKTPVPSSYKQGTYSRTGSVASQVGLYLGAWLGILQYLAVSCFRRTCLCISLGWDEVPVTGAVWFPSVSSTYRAPPPPWSSSATKVTSALIKASCKKNLYFEEYSDSNLK